MLLSRPEIFENFVLGVGSFQALKLSLLLQRVQQHILLLPLSFQEVLSIFDLLSQFLTGSLDSTLRRWSID